MLHPFAQYRQHPSCVVLAFKSEDAIIRKADKRGLATQPRPDFFGEPPIQHRVQINVAEQRRQS
jgi:hypothetical protein